MDEAKQKRFSGVPLPPPAYGSPKLKQIVLKACAYDPNLRYQTPEALYADLAAAQSGSCEESTIPPHGATQSNRQEQTYGQDERTQGNAWENEYDATQGSVQSDSGYQGGTVGGESTAGKGMGPFDVKQILPVNSQEAASGCQKVVALQDGKRISVKVPAGVKEGSLLRIVGGGKEDPQTGAKGNAYIQIHIGEAEFVGFGGFGDIFQDIFGGNSGKKPEQAVVVLPNQAKNGCRKTFKLSDGTEKTLTIPQNCKDKQVVDGVTVYVYDLTTKPKDFRNLPDAVVQAYANEKTGMGRNLLLTFVGWMIFGIASMMIPVMAIGLTVSVVAVVVVGINKGQSIEAAKNELALRQKKRKG